jgi:hypothetical protein
VWATMMFLGLRNVYREIKFTKNFIQYRQFPDRDSNLTNTSLELYLVNHNFILIRIVGGGVHIESTRQVGHYWPIVPAPGDCNDGEFGGMKIGRGNRSTRRKPAPAPLCPSQIPLDKTRARTRAAAVGSQRLTT